MQLYRAIYLSRSCLPRNDIGAVDALVAASWKRNSQNGVTGMMVYLNGSFIQVLEGDRPIVAPLLDRIMEDPRHCDVILADFRGADERLFTGWSMGLSRPDQQTAKAYSFDTLSALSAKQLYGLLRTFEPHVPASLDDQIQHSDIIHL